MTEDRLARARAVLVREGLEAEVAAAGEEGEIVAVRAPIELRAALARVAPELRSCGFRYVAIELNGREPGRSGNQ